MQAAISCADGSSRRQQEPRRGDSFVSLSPDTTPYRNANMASIGPYHTTLPHVTKDNWRDLAAQKREQQAQLIPAEWRLSPELVSQAGDDVTGIAEQSGILSARELEITELDEVKEVRRDALLADGTACGEMQQGKERANSAIDRIYSSRSVSRTRRILPRKWPSRSRSAPPSLSSSRTASSLSLISRFRMC
jgi:hypothetical protein